MLEGNTEEETNHEALRLLGFAEPILQMEIFLGHREARSTVPATSQPSVQLDGNNEMTSSSTSLYTCHLMAQRHDRGRGAMLNGPLYLLMLSPRLWVKVRELTDKSQRLAHTCV